MSNTTIPRQPPSVPSAASAPTPAWHAAESDTVMTELETRLTGLVPEEARRRLEVLGPNALPRARRESPWALVWRQIDNPLIWVLVAAAVVAVAMGKTVDGIVVLGVVVLNTIIGFVQEFRAGRAIEALEEMVPDRATVVRDGRTLSVSAADLVPGDIVTLQSGDRVPADVRLLAVRGLQVEEAALTGESVPTLKSPATLPEGAGLGDRRNMAYGGTLVTYGTGTGVVVATGAGTELGRISSMLREATRLDTPLMKQLAVVGRWLTIGIVAVAAAMLVVGLARGYALMDAALAAITLAVGAIPEGLPAIVTIALAIGVQRMASRKAVIRRLPAAETLGSTTVICSDKTGTLTRNEMTVREIRGWHGAWRLGGTGYAPAGEVVAERETAGGADELRGILRAGALCSDAGLYEEDGAWLVTGDPTEGALVVAARKGGMDEATLRRTWPRLDAVPFESERQFMATLHATPQGGRVILLKGAPEAVLRRVDAWSDGSPVDTDAVLAAVEEMAARGMRVLALAERVPAVPGDTLGDDEVEAGFTLLGLQGMIDPPRAEAVDSVNRCHGAGITVKMITGDHPATARAIGQELGLLERGGEVVTGKQLAAMSDREVETAARRSNVFARVAPEHKLRLVRALQAQGQVVAMTGDGVNDAPALKQADIGVAMGITGTAASREASDMVLTDDNFASIAAAVEEGRRVYDNLVKSLAFVLPTNLGLAVILLAAVAFFPIIDGNPLLPMTPTQILWINLVATVALALPLAFEAKEPDVMRRAPRKPGAAVLSGFVVARTVGVALLMAAGAVALFLWEYGAETARGVPADVALREAQTMAVTTVILFQVFYLLNCRSLRDSLLRIGVFSNPTVYLGIGGILLLQAAFVYLPAMNTLFGTAPLTGEALLKSLVVASVVLPIISLEKAIRGRSAPKPKTRGIAKLGENRSGSFLSF